MVGRAYSEPNSRNAGAEYCLTCSCSFDPQQEELGCFLTAMHYVSQLSGLDLTMEYIRGLFVADNKPFDGVTVNDVPSMMRDVFGDDYSDILPSSDAPKDYMRTMLDMNKIIITNYPVNTEHGMYAHAVVVVGYVAIADYVIYTCLDPASGEYYIKYEEDLNWNSSNKFMVSVYKYL